MKEVVIKTGTYGFRAGSGRVCPVSRGERVNVTDEEAARLVSLGVAAFVDASAEATDMPPALPPDGGDPGGGRQEESPAEAAAGNEEDGPDKSDAEVARLERMQKADLEQMAVDMGLDVSGVKTKHDLAVLIVAAGEADDGEAPPDLGAGDIVQ